MNFAKHAALSLVAALALVFSAASDLRAEVSSAVTQAIANGDSQSIATALASASPADAQAISALLVLSGKSDVIAAVLVAVAASASGGTSGVAATSLTTALATSTATGAASLVQAVFQAVAATPGVGAQTVANLAVNVTAANPSLQAAVVAGAQSGGAAITAVNNGNTITVTVTLPNANQVAQQQGSTS